MSFLPRSTFVAGMILLVLSATPSQAQQAYSPAVGSSERKELLDLMRAPVERDLQRKVIFKVERLNVIGDWAVARVIPLEPSGAAVDYRKTKYRGRFETGMFDPGGEALLRRKKGAWSLLEWRFGATDTALPYWIETHQAPAALLK